MAAMTTSTDDELLTAEQERELARRVEAGVLARAHPELVSASEAELAALIADGREAWLELWNRNLRLVRHLSIAAANRHLLPADELFQEGCLGLAEALLRYDFRRGTRFSTVAWSWISNRVRDAITLRCGQLAGSVHGRRLQIRAERAAVALAAEHGQDVSVHHIAEAINENPSAVSRAIQVRQTTLPEGFDIEDPGATQAFERVEAPTLSFLRRLSSIERQVLQRRFGIGGVEHTLAETAAAMNMSLAAVRRLEQAALAKARIMMTAAA